MWKVQVNKTVERSEAWWESNVADEGVRFVKFLFYTVTNGWRLFSYQNKTAHFWAIKISLAKIVLLVFRKSAQKENVCCST